MISEVDKQGFDRITFTPGVMGGKACIRGMRVTVGMIVRQIAGGATPDELLAEFPYLEREDITQALGFAAWRLDERVDAAHLFASSTTRIGLRRNAWLRGYVYAFIEYFAPHLTRRVVDAALAGGGEDPGL